MTNREMQRYTVPLRKRETLTNWPEREMRQLMQRDTQGADDKALDAGWMLDSL